MTIKNRIKKWLAPFYQTEVYPALRVTQAFFALLFVSLVTLAMVGPYLFTDSPNLQERIWINLGIATLIAGLFLWTLKGKHQGPLLVLLVISVVAIFGTAYLDGQRWEMAYGTLMYLAIVPVIAAMTLSPWQNIFLNIGLIIGAFIFKNFSPEFPALHFKALVVFLLFVEVMTFGLAMMSHWQARVIEKQKESLIEQEKFQAIGQISGWIAHEINNPLAIIMGKSEYWTEVLNDPKSSQKIDTTVLTKDMQKIATTAMRTAKIVQSIRSLSRDLKREPMETFTVETLLHDALDLCHDRMKRHGVTLKFQNGVPSLVIQGRKVHLEQILINTIINACDAVVNLQERWIEVSAILNEKGRLEFRIKDSGNGIPEDVAARIFEPLFTTKDKSTGTGLGLVLCRKMAVAHGGRYELDPTQPNTTFVLEIPIGYTSKLKAA